MRALPRGSRARITAAFASIVAIACAAFASEGAAQQPVTPDDFVAAAGGADQYEIMAGRVALTESHDPDIRAFAARMVQEHQAAFEALGQAAMGSGLKPPSTSVGGDQAMLLAALQGVRGAEFDRAYARQQLLAHIQALTVERHYAREGSDPNLRQTAQSDLPMIEHHLHAAERLKSEKGD